MLGVFPSAGLGDPALADRAITGDRSDDFGSDYDTETMEPTVIRRCRPGSQPGIHPCPTSARTFRPDLERHGLGPITEESARTVSTDQIDLDGLPMRVRQASLAPQLFQQPAAASAEPHVAAAARSAEPSPEAARSTFAALQRGWERGRSETGEADSARRRLARANLGKAPTARKRTTGGSP